MKKAIRYLIPSIFCLQLLISQSSLSQLPYTELNDSIIFFDNFDSYSPDESLYGQNPDDWFMFTGAPGPFSPIITDTFSYSNPNAVVFDHSWETIIKPIGNYDTGIYSIDFLLYFPENKTGMFSTFSYFDYDIIEYGMQVFFEEEGQGALYAGSFTPILFEYNYDIWYSNKIIVDLNNDWAVYYINGELIHSWIWTLSAYGNGSIKKLGGSEFAGYSWSGTFDPEFFLDDYKLTELDNIPCFDPPQNLTYSIIYPDQVLISWEPPNCPNLLGYNVYFEGALLDFTTTISYLNILPPGTYEMCITAVYESGESDCAWITIVIVGQHEIDNPQLSVYPIPADKIIYINSERKITGISIFTLSGQLQMEFLDIMEQKCYVNTSKLNPGIYLIRIETKAKTIHKRIVIQ